MNIVIRYLSNISENIETVRFPCDEETLDKICDSLGIEMTTEPNYYILDSSDKDFLRILPNNLCNIDELNYLMKRLDGFGPKEIKQFYAVAFAENSKTMAELINLSFNMHCYSLITDFSDFNKVGKDLYLFDLQENELIKIYTPLLNIVKNPLKLKELQNDRNQCKNIAVG